MAKRVFQFLCRVSNITLYYVNAGSLVSEGNVVCFCQQRDRSGAVGRKEIKNELGNTNEMSERRSRTNSFYGSERYQTMLEWLVVIGWCLAIFFLSSILTYIAKASGSKS